MIAGLRCCNDLAAPLHAHMPTRDFRIGRRRYCNGKAAAPHRGPQWHNGQAAPLQWPGCVAVWQPKMVCATKWQPTGMARPCCYMNFKAAMPRHSWLIVLCGTMPIVQKSQLPEHCNSTMLPIVQKPPLLLASQLPLRVRAQLPLLRACPHLQPPVHLAGMYLISISTNRH